DAPVAVDDTGTTAEDAAVSFTQDDLKGNDTDVDNSNAQLSVTAVSNASNGNVVLNLDGTVTFSPDLNFNGTAGFDYTVSDGSLSDIGHVTITVTAANDAPVAVDDTGTTAEDVAVSFTQDDLKGNDTDVDNSNAQLNVTAVSNPSNGSVVLNLDGTVTFSSDLNCNGTAGFDYTVSDGLLTDIGHMTITVTAANDAPVAVDDTGTTAEDVAVSFTQDDLKGNDTDADNSNAQLNVTAVSNASNGSVVLNLDGTVTFSPDLNFNGTAGFDYTLSDGSLTDIGHMTITVTAVNDAPVAVDDTGTTTVDVAVSFTQDDLKGNDTDVDNSNAQLNVTAVSNASNGSVVLNLDGTVTFSPDLNFNGTAGFDYTVSDGSLSDIGHMTITVTAVNDAPVAVDDTGTTTVDVAVSFTQDDLKGNDTDVDNSNAQLNVTAVSNASNGSVVLNLDGTVTFSPDLNFNGTAGFDYTVSDGLLTDIGHMTITVTAVNDAPVAVDDTGTTAEDVAVSFTQDDLKGNDTDADNSNAQLNVTVVSNPSNGSVVLNLDGTVTFSPDLNFNGTAGFDYTVSDGSLTDIGHMTITVTAVNDAPVAVDDTGTTIEDVAVSFTQDDLKGNDTDVDISNAQLIVTAVSNASNGSVVLNLDGTVTFSPDLNFNGTAGFDYTLSDGSLTDIGHMTITVTAVNDAPVALADTGTTAEDTAISFPASGA